MIATDRTGQSIIESCLAIFIICLIFVGIFQVAQIHAAREILHHSAARAARAKTVGFNQWMVRKVARVAAIPNAGRMTCPFSSFSDPQIQAAASNSVPGQLWMDVLSGALVPPDTQVNIEIARIPEYLWCPTPAQALNTLDYTNWNSVAIQDLTASGPQIVSPIAQPPGLPVERGAAGVVDHALQAQDGRIGSPAQIAPLDGHGLLDGPQGSVEKLLVLLQQLLAGRQSSPDGAGHLPHVGAEPRGRGFEWLAAGAGHPVGQIRAVGATSAVDVLEPVLGLGQQLAVFFDQLANPVIVEVSDLGQFQPLEDHGQPFLVCPDAIQKAPGPFDVLAHLAVHDCPVTLQGGNRQVHAAGHDKPSRDDHSGQHRLIHVDLRFETGVELTPDRTGKLIPPQRQRPRRGSNHRYDPGRAF